MRFFAALSMLLAGAGLCRAGDINAEVLREINFARTSPKAYARQLSTVARPSAALREAIAFLQRAHPCPAITLSDAMSAASREHVASQGAAGEIGHRGADGSSPWTRLARFGVWQRAAGEVICYGRHTARDTVAALIVDEGVPNRGHRRSIFNSAFSVAGVAWGSHARYGTMCVVDFAGGFTAETGAGGHRIAGLY